MSVLGPIRTDLEPQRPQEWRGLQQTWLQGSIQNTLVLFPTEVFSNCTLSDPSHWTTLPQETLPVANSMAALVFRAFTPSHRGGAAAEPVWFI